MVLSSFYSEERFTLIIPQRPSGGINVNVTGLKKKMENPGRINVNIIVNVYRQNQYITPDSSLSSLFFSEIYLFFRNVPFR